MHLLPQVVFHIFAVVHLKTSLSHFCWHYHVHFCICVLLQAYTSGKFREMVKACINQDLSWSQPAKKWEAVLEEVYKGCTAAPAKKASVATPVQAKQAAMSR